MDSYEGDPASDGQSIPRTGLVDGAARLALVSTTSDTSITAPNTAPGRGKGPLAARESLLCEPKKVPNQLRCGICHLVAHEPKATPTGIVYCKSCIESALALRPSCPVTKNPLEQGDLIDIQASRPVLWNIFEQIQVRCVHHVYGCNWTGSIAVSSAHNRSCTFQSWVSKCTWCGKLWQPAKWTLIFVKNASNIDVRDVH